MLSTVIRTLFYFFKNGKNDALEVDSDRIKDKKKIGEIILTHHSKLDMNTTNSAGHVLNFRIELNGLSRNISTPVQSDHSSDWSRLTTQTT